MEKHEGKLYPQQTRETAVSEGGLQYLSEKHIKRLGDKNWQLYTQKDFHNVEGEVYYAMFKLVDADRFEGYDNTVRLALDAGISTPDDFLPGYELNVHYNPPEGDEPIDTSQVVLEFEFRGFPSGRTINAMRHIEAAVDPPNKTSRRWLGRFGLLG